jgi:uncharacterized membrane protein
MTDRDERLEGTIRLLLRAGAWLTTLLLLAGLALHVFSGVSAASEMLLRAGFLALMGTPILRVLIACVAYFRERDWLFALTTLTVLVVLALSVGVAVGRR